MNTEILLVEDTKLLRLAAERALVRAGYEVVTAGDGEAALEMARKENPHVVLLDMLEVAAGGYICDGRHISVLTARLRCR